jgi:light-regulated signal transduction histidine kinase (bacteriophytochrome)
MEDAIQAFQLRIQALDASESEKAGLLQLAERFKKEVVRMDFQVKRTIKDKSIMVNLLNRTIDELRLRQEEIVEANHELQFQKQLVEEQSDKLAEQLHMLEKSFAELEQFSYIASHDLKSPLRTIASYAGLLRRRYSDKLDSEANEFIDYIVKGASHMNEIIRDLLEYAGTNKSGHFELVCLNEVVGLVKQNLQTEISESQAKIECADLPAVSGHRTGLLQLFQNLLANAIKFQGKEPVEIIVNAREVEKYWEITVKDNGLGLDEIYQEKVFMPFQRISHLDRPGTGMGLAICKKIVKMHGGDIWYKSEVDRGTIFYVTLPKEFVLG